jgi:hypothetical protein
LFLSITKSSLSIRHAGSTTATGTELLLFVPSPNTPRALFPQQYARLW